MNTYNQKQWSALAVGAILLSAVSAGSFAQESRVLETSLPAANFGSVAACTDGAPILDQTPNQANGIFSDADCDFCNGGAGGSQAVADDFILASETDIGELIMYSGYFPGDIIPMPADPWTITFHADAGGLPGAAISSQDVVPEGVLTGVTLFGVSEIQYTFVLNTVTLPAGTYWLEITTDSAGNTDSAFWEVGNPDPGAGRDGTAFAFEVPGVTWMPTAMQDFAITMCGPIAMLPPPPAVPTLSKTGLTIMVLLLLLCAGVTVRRFN